jgi:hypothetical protein
MYFMPASFARRTQASASYFTGLKSLAIGLVVGHQGILPRFMIHSPMPGICLPCVGAGGHGVDAPVDEHAEARLAPPAHARVLLLLGLVGVGVGRFRGLGGSPARGRTQDCQHQQPLAHRQSPRIAQPSEPPTAGAEFEVELGPATPMLSSFHDMDVRHVRAAGPDGAAGVPPPPTEATHRDVNTAAPERRHSCRRQDQTGRQECRPPTEAIHRDVNTAYPERRHSCRRQDQTGRRECRPPTEATHRDVNTAYPERRHSCRRQDQTGRQECRPPTEATHRDVNTAYPERRHSCRRQDQTGRQECRPPPHRSGLAAERPFRIRRARVFGLGMGA